MPLDRDKKCPRSWYGRFGYSLNGNPPQLRCIYQWQIAILEDCDLGVSDKHLSDQLKPELAANQGGSSLKGLDRNVAFRLQDAVDLCAAGMHALGERGFVDAQPFHFLGELPSNHPSYRFGLCRLTGALSVEECIEGRAPMGVHFGHAIISFMRRRPKSRSSAGVFCVFLMNPCTTPIRPSWAKNRNRAIRRLASDLRTSHKPPPSGRQSGIPIGYPNCTV